MVQDQANQWIQSHPCKTKTSQKTEKSLRKFLEPSSQKPELIYTDKSLEVVKSCDNLSWNHRISTPHRSETNGIAERAVRRGKKGRLLYCCNQARMKTGYLLNVQDFLADGKTPYERRFGEPFSPKNSFWCNG